MKKLTVLLIPLLILACEPKHSEIVQPQPWFTYDFTASSGLTAKEIIDREYEIEAAYRTLYLQLNPGSTRELVFNWMPHGNQYMIICYLTGEENSRRINDPIKPPPPPPPSMRR